ncbi:MAG: peptide chain release factor-like protein [Deltaproteobacteria bacterium]|jgi:peptide chain release factor|nr:peptide chain release factor-like protein [Deltaproteobacteria bacterium]
MTRIQISSGRGPAECELAVGFYLTDLSRRHPQAQVIKSDGEKKLNIDGKSRLAYRSVEVELPDEAVPPVGSVRWRAKSPLRPNHGRQNWFIQVAVVEREATDLIEPNGPGFERELRYATFRSPGQGGQNVNKVETGARVTHEPSGITAESTTARTQKANKTLALARLKAKLARMGETKRLKEDRTIWLKHSQMERGNAVQTFEGLGFHLTEN